MRAPDAEEVVRVPMGGLAVRSEAGWLAAYGVGSCVIVVLYDREARVGGLSHAMLPRRASPDESAWKFVDSALDHLLAQIESAGASRERLAAKLIGGASMFRSAVEMPGQAMGERNLAAAREELERLAIPIETEDVGGEIGRTVFFDVSTGEVRVRSLDGMRAL